MAHLLKSTVDEGVRKLREICSDITSPTCIRKGNKIYWLDGETPVASLAVTPRCLKLTDLRRRLAWEMRFA